MKAYLCAPMRGYDLYNFPAIDSAAIQLEKWGWQVYSPAKHDRKMGFDPTLTLDEQDFDLAMAMEWDVKHVLKANAVVCLPGWQDSVGCKVELTVARAIELTILEYKMLEYDDRLEPALELVSGYELDGVLDGEHETADVDLDELLEVAESEGYDRAMSDGAGGWLRGYSQGFAAAKQLAEATPSDQALEAKFTEGYFIGRNYARDVINTEIAKAGERCRERFAYADRHHGRDPYEPITVDSYEAA